MGGRGASSRSNKGNDAPTEPPRKRAEKDVPMNMWY